MILRADPVFLPVHSHNAERTKQGGTAGKQANLRDFTKRGGQKGSFLPVFMPKTAF